jgi:hypothetical protein
MNTNFYFRERNSMRSVITWMGLVATALLAGCASEPAKDSSPAAAEPVAAVSADPASSKPAAGEPTATQAALADQPSATDDNEVVCRNEKPLGTRIGKRVCKTRAQLKQEEASAREMMKNRDQKSHGVTDGITGGG